MCIQCTSFLVFCDDLMLRLMTLEEVSNLPCEVFNTLIRMRRAVMSAAAALDSGSQDRCVASLKEIFRNGSRR
jgi:hypothetical protein